MDGHSYDEIAQKIGFSHHGSAYRAVQTALGDRQVESVDQLRQLETDRLDALQAALRSAAMTGDAKAMNAVLRIIDYRIRLLCLDKRHPVEIDRGHMLVLGPTG